MNPRYEYRAFSGIEIREAPKDSGFIAVLTGIAAPFNKDSVRFTGWERDWVERIAPGAFTRTLKDNPDVVGLWSHDPNKPVARTPDSLSLREADAGLAFEMSLPDTSVARDLLTNVRAKIVNGVSFAFEAVRTLWSEAPEMDTRTLLDVNLFEISPTVWPAYPDTNVAARSQSVLSVAGSGGEYLRQIMEERKAQLRAAPEQFPMRETWAARLGLRK